MKVIYFFAVTASAMLATGCATTKGLRLYPGDARPVDSIAQIIVSAEFDVKTIDGTKTSAGMFATARESVFEILPGRHEIVARFYSPFENGSPSSATTYDKPDRSEYQTLILEAAPGRRYSIQRRTEDRNIILFMNGSGAAQPLAIAAVPAKPATMQQDETPAPAKIAAPAAQIPAAAEPAKKETVEPPRITPLDNLKQWWFYASPQERAQFRDWMNAQKP